MNKELFKQRMAFNPSLAGHISCEREFFLVNKQGLLVPRAHDALSLLNDDEFFSYELSACQLEYKTGPMSNIAKLMARIDDLEKQCEYFEKKLNIERLLLEVGPPDMPLDVYPDERYQSFAKTKTPEQLMSMMRVTACQFHVGMPNYETALRIYDAIIDDIPQLITQGDYSKGQRMALYKQATQHWYPSRMYNLDDHYFQAITAGYEDNINNCHSIIRITRYGTIEFRMFGADPYEDIPQLAETCLRYLKQ